MLALEYVQDNACQSDLLHLHHLNATLNKVFLFYTSTSKKLPQIWYGFRKEIVECPGLSSIGSMGFLRNPKAFLMVLKAVIEKTNYRFILFSSGYQPLDSAIQSIASSLAQSRECQASPLHCDSTLLFDGRLFCFSGWLFPKCAVAIHHAGSGSTAAALFAGIPQIACPFLLDQFYWAESLHWTGLEKPSGS
ncbi:hypothetical protein E2562_006879 [Oryza meyeriana var. granulata]|uniref:Erythromycin biosynthesis protein CIII-like C-terminal domain-containing protein n=1 Tax=Oryza meyeriana var. granulata TaxID=110450 RepID=A0A6G1BJN1_9ORYZ|nr:hypothetical protein E2562_006879 [Oryza meyeriana var. granulata]